MNATATDVVTEFHKQYYKGPLWYGNKWFDIPIQKCPLDLFVYQEIINEVKPDFIIETGTMQGGSAFFLGMMCQLRNQGHVISIDVDARHVPAHPRITYILSDSVAPELLAMLKEKVKGTVMVILDSDHSKEHVLNELRLYAPLVTKGSYLIVEDTNLSGHPIETKGEGPLEAVQEFMQETEEFVTDVSREKFLMTFNKNGYLRKL